MMTPSPPPPPPPPCLSSRLPVSEKKDDRERQNKRKVLQNQYCSCFPKRYQPQPMGRSAGRGGEEYSSNTHEPKPFVQQQV
ncbi:hypothetical protein COCNU_scaffold027143G000010 [Cocos nucifera]|nr:hypothetical protein [Cocos nucifera]